MKKGHPPVVLIIGPGGAGKSTAGALLAHRLGWLSVDLDNYFSINSGNISRFIGQHGYKRYAQQNVENYFAISAALIEPSVLVLSSGFMTYPDNIDSRYSAIRAEIEAHPLTALLLPSFDLEKCVAIIVERQLQRTYLSGNKNSEEKRIRSRFPRFMSLRCNRFLSGAEPTQVALELERFVRLCQRQSDG